MRADAKGLLAVAVLLLAVVLCGGALAADERSRWGFVLPLTGAQAKFGEIEKRSFEMAAEEINAKRRGQRDRRSSCSSRTTPGSRTSGARGSRS